LRRLREEKVKVKELHGEQVEKQVEKQEKELYGER
jgi:hypothetical protein